MVHLHLLFMLKICLFEQPGGVLLPMIYLAIKNENRMEIIILWPGSCLLFQSICFNYLLRVFESWAFYVYVCVQQKLEFNLKKTPRG